MPHGLLAVLIGVGAVGDLYYCRFDGCPQGLPTVFIGVGDLYCCRYGGCPHGLQVVLIGGGVVDDLYCCYVTPLISLYKEYLENLNLKIE